MDLTTETLKIVIDSMVDAGLIEILDDLTEGDFKKVIEETNQRLNEFMKEEDAELKKVIEESESSLNEELEDQEERGFG